MLQTRCQRMQTLPNYKRRRRAAERLTTYCRTVAGALYLINIGLENNKTWRAYIATVTLWLSSALPHIPSNYVVRPYLCRCTVVGCLYCKALVKSTQAEHKPNIVQSGVDGVNKRFEVNLLKRTYSQSSMYKSNAYVEIIVLAGEIIVLGPMKTSPTQLQNVVLQSYDITLRKSYSFLQYKDFTYTASDQYKTEIGLL